MICKCKDSPQPDISFFITSSPTKIAEKRECPVCHQREYKYRYLAEENVPVAAVPKRLGTGILLCRVCNTMAGVLVMHSGQLMCMKCAKDDREKEK